MASEDFVYYKNIDKIKVCLHKNIDKIYSGFVLINRLDAKLVLVVIAQDKKIQSKLKKFLVNNKMDVEFVFYTLDDYKKLITNKEITLSTASDYAINSFFIVGVGITEEMVSYIKSCFNADEKIIYKDQTINVSDFNIFVGRAAGALVFNKNTKKFLALKYAVGDKYWNAPKGGIAEGELIQDTLKRELLEETSIKDIKVLENSCSVSMYNYYSSYYKNIRKIYVTYYPTITKTENIVLSEEHSEYKWISIDDVDSVITYPGGRRVYKHLGQFLLKKFK